MTIDADPSGTRTIKASEFKAKCLKLMDEVAESGGEIIITKKRQARLAPGALPGEAGDVGRARPRQDRDTRRHHRTPSTWNGRPSPIRTGC